MVVGTLASDLASIASAQVRPGERTTEFFRSQDKNQDGRLSRDELPDRLRANFDRVDADRDGFITPQEDATFRSRGRAKQREPGQQRRPREPRVPEGIVATLDIAYAGNDNPRQKLDLYLPESRSSDKPLPVVVWIHGGAWRAGSKAGGIGRFARFAQSGHYASVSIGYRLTDEAIWPAQIHDCKAAIRWIRAHAGKYNLDPDRIGVWGASAGGHLVAMLGTSGGVRALEGELGEHADQDSRVTCVVDYYGPSDLLAMSSRPSIMDHDAPDSPESTLVGGPLQETVENAKSASTTTYVSKDDPPFLVVHGDKDPLVPHDQSVRLIKLLREAGVDVTFITIAGGGHGGFDGEELTRRVDAFFAKHLRDEDTQIAGGTLRPGQRADGE
jgi:acetyl esterase/lipase